MAWFKWKLNNQLSTLQQESRQMATRSHKSGEIHVSEIYHHPSLHFIWNTSIQRVLVNDIKHTILTYDDDVLLYTSNPEIDAKEIYVPSIYLDYLPGTCTGYKLNIQKTQVSSVWLSQWFI